MAEIHQEFWDPTRLEDMVGGDEAFILELLQLFLESTGGDVQALADASKTQEYSHVAHRAHTIKGASGNIGADKLMSVAGRLEQHAKTEQGRVLDPMIAEVVATYDQTVHAIQARIQR